MPTLLQTLSSNPGARKKRKEVGRGNGSGHGTYSTRGMNGQRQRTGSRKRPGFEGGQTPLYRKMPKLKGFNNPCRVTYQVVNVGNLNIFEENEEIDVVKLYEKHLISHKGQPVKILGDGELKKKLALKVDKFSGLAKEKIEKAGGTITGYIKSES
jgi:large subunit ribosomal protein L15